jgi:hypothetical protein
MLRHPITSLWHSCRSETCWPWIVMIEVIVWMNCVTLCSRFVLIFVVHCLLWLCIDLLLVCPWSACCSSWLAMCAWCSTWRAICACSCPWLAVCACSCPWLALMLAVACSWLASACSWLWVSNLISDWFDFIRLLPFRQYVLFWLNFCQFLFAMRHLPSDAPGIFARLLVWLKIAYKTHDL